MEVASGWSENEPANRTSPPQLINGLDWWEKKEGSVADWSFVNLTITVTCLIAFLTLPYNILLLITIMRNRHNRFPEQVSVLLQIFSIVNIACFLCLPFSIASTYQFHPGFLCTFVPVILLVGNSFSYGVSICYALQITFSIVPKLNTSLKLKIAIVRYTTVIGLTLSLIIYAFLPYVMGFGGYGYSHNFLTCTLRYIPKDFNKESFDRGLIFYGVLFIMESVKPLTGAFLHIYAMVFLIKCRAGEKVHLQTDGNAQRLYRRRSSTDRGSFVYTSELRDDLIKRLRYLVEGKNRRLAHCKRSLRLFGLLNLEHRVQLCDTVKLITQRIHIEFVLICARILVIGQLVYGFYMLYSLQANTFSSEAFFFSYSTYAIPVLEFWVIFYGNAEVRYAMRCSLLLLKERCVYGRKMDESPATTVSDPLERIDKN